MELIGKIGHEDSPEVAVIMADINNLKYVNDKFGHKSGDEYIKGCFGILKDSCKSSHIYRVGGDEFVIVLEDDDYTGRKLLLPMLKSHFIDTYTDESKEPWERYSVSLGLSEYQDSDTGLADIMKRADDAMYADKNAFKAKYGSYR